MLCFAFAGLFPFSAFLLEKSPTLYPRTFMLKTEKPLWIHPKTDLVWKNKIVQEFNIHPVAAQILISRGFTNLGEIHQFLYGQLPSLYDPNLFLDMPKAVARILKAISQKEPILVYGDNDVDGMSGSALLTEFLTLLQGKVFSYLSNRADIKTTMLDDALFFAKKNHCKLLITVDCGITAHREIEKATSMGLDVIVTDHHEPVAKIPNCLATLNPKLLESNYPNRELTGVGVAFKLAHGITNYLIQKGELSPSSIDLKDFLDLVALGTIADMGALTDENRILVRYGLKTLQTTKRIGLKKLMNSCDIDTSSISTNEVASKIAPRLNSLGRIADPNKGVSLLLCKEEKKALKLCAELDAYNLQRQKIERTVTEDIELFLKKKPHLLKEKALLLYSENWHPGVIPILASRIAKQYNRPTIIIAFENGIGKGSARTIAEYPLLPVLKKNASLLMNFGGHDFAAGLTIKKENLSLFKKRFIEEVNSSLKEQDLVAKLYLDAEIAFSDLTFDFMESLTLLEPFGNENPPPILYTKAWQSWPPKILGKSHLKMFLEQKERNLEAIGFNLAYKKPLLRKKHLALQIAFTPYVNAFMNKQSIQIQVKDFQVLPD